MNNVPENTVKKPRATVVVVGDAVESVTVTETPEAEAVTPEPEPFVPVSRTGRKLNKETNPNE